METKEMSSEAEEQVTEEAANTEEEKVTSPAEEVQVGLHVVTKLRESRQEEREGRIRAEERLAVMTEQQAKQTPPAVSPIDAFIAQEREEGVKDDDIVISAPLFQKQKVYEAQVANEAAVNTAKNDLAVLQATSTKAAMQVHTDWQEVIDAGQVLLTKGEHIDVTTSGKEFGELAYAKCQAAIARNKKPDPKAEAPPKKEPSEPAAEETKPKEEVKEEAKSQEEILANASPAAAAAVKLSSSLLNYGAVQ